MTGSSSKAVHRYSIELRVRKYIKGYGFCHFHGFLATNIDLK